MMRHMTVSSNKLIAFLKRAASIQGIDFLRTDRPWNENRVNDNTVYLDESNDGFVIDLGDDCELQSSSSSILGSSSSFTLDDTAE